jgi:hypothetical protein
MSESAQSASHSASVRSEAHETERLCRFVYAKLSDPISTPLSVSSHRRATDRLVRLKEAIEGGDTLCPSSKTALLCAGVALSKRLVAGPESDEDVASISVTMTLLFVLLVLNEGSDGIQQDEMEEFAGADGKTQTRRVLREDELLLNCWSESSLSDFVFADANHFASSIGDALRSHARVARAALSEARYVQSDTLDAYRSFAFTFFRSSAAASARQLLSGQAAEEFVSLGAAARLNNALKNRADLLAALAEGGESEAGQQALRDIILSFKLPNSIIGVRRTLLLSREASTNATRSRPEVVNEAHEAAMRGAAWCWGNDNDPVHKAAAVLAGLSLALSGANADIRKGDAFGGRLFLPFLETRPSKSKGLRLGLLGSDWVLLEPRSSGVRVRSRSSGFDGFCDSVLMLTQQ